MGVKPSSLLVLIVQLYVLCRYYYYSEDTADPDGPKSYKVTHIHQMHLIKFWAISLNHAS